MSRRCRLGMVFFLLLALLMVCGVHSAMANVVLESVNGRAVLEGGADRARGRAINNALRKALRRYIFEDQGVSPKFEKRVNQEIVDNRNRFIQSYEILRERTLGDLYQVELRVELRDDLIDQVLAGIEQHHKQKVERLTLVLLPPVSLDGAAPAAPVLEAPMLMEALRGELKAYGFTLEASGPPTGDLKTMLSRVLGTPGDEDRGREIDAGLFKGMLPGDLIVVVRSSPAVEEKIASLGKSLWKARAELAFIDVRNRRIIHLAPVSAKVINRDYVAGIETLTRTLTGRVRDACLDRLLRDYVIPGEKLTEVVLECRGFRRPAEFAFFRKRLESLRSVSQVRIQALAAGLIELHLKLVTPPQTLLAWLNDFQDPEFPARLTAYRAGGTVDSAVVMRVDCDASVPGD